MGGGYDTGLLAFTRDNVEMKSAVWSWGHEMDERRWSGEGGDNTKKNQVGVCFSMPGI